MDTPERTSATSPAEPLGVALSLGLFLSCLDVFLAAAQPDWLGGPWPAWRAWFAGLAILVVPVAVTATLSWALLKKSRLRHAAPPCGGLVAVLIWWRVLAGTEDGVSISMELTVYGVLIAWAVLHVAANVLRPRQSVIYDVATVAALTAGVVLLRNCAHLFFLDPDRAASWRAWSVLWTAFSFLFCLGFGWFAWSKDARRVGLVGTVVVVCFSLPVAMSFVPRLLSVGLDKRGPSVLLITADALRADYCSTYGGHVPTPAMDAMASRGTRFERFRTLAPWTIPSLNGMFASKYPPGLTPYASLANQRKEMLGYARLRDYWCDPGSRTLVRELTRKRYATCVLLGNPVMADEEWLLGGFRHRFVADPLTNRVHPFRQNPLLQAVLNRAWPALFCERPADSTWLLTKCAMLFLERYGQGDFFLWLHYMDPHLPYDPPERFRKQADDRSSFPGSHPLSWALEVSCGDVQPEVGQKAHLQSLYEGEIQYVDAALDRVVRQIDGLGLVDSTYVIFSSDHGEEFWDHGRQAHGKSLYDELLRVPFVIVGPGIARQVVDEPVSAIDLMPTLADLLHLDVSEAQRGWHGVSFGSVLLGPHSPETLSPTYARATNVFCDQEPLEVIITPSHKLVRGLESGSLELYLLDEDPDERVNCADAHPELVQRLTEALDAWDALYPSTFEAALAQTGHTKLEAPSQETLDLFRDIGYLDDESSPTE